MLAPKERTLRASLVVALIVTIAGNSAAAATPTTRQKLDFFVSTFAERGPINGTVLVGHGGKILLARGFGFANMSLDVQNTVHTKYEVASITKTFTALIALRLVDEGRIDLYATIRKYLPDFPAPWGDKVTIEQLLTHTGGVQGDITDFPTSGHNFPPVVAQVNGDFFSLDEQISLIAARPLLFEPGTQYSYSSDGYTILGAIIAAITGQSYEAVLDSYIFRPFHLDHSGYAPQTVVVPELASGYHETWNGYENARRIGISPAGGMYSTVEDLFKWTRAVRSGALMSTRSKTLAWTLSPNITQYGWKRTQDNAAKADALRVSCSGALPGANALVTLTLQDDITVIVLTNTRQMTFRLDELTRGIIDIVRGKTPPQIKRSFARRLAASLAHSEFTQASSLVENFKAHHRSEFYADEEEINSLGYYFLGAQNTRAAVMILKFNAGLFPTSANAFDSLGEAFLDVGDSANAIANYRKSLELNPKNTNAEKMLQKLQTRE
jgi:CubicO group peptidase (beta-lactamase class C family)